MCQKASVCSLQSLPKGCFALGLAKRLAARAAETKTLNKEP